jgi:hypothetical protein
METQRWVIPNDSALRLRILHENHDSKVAGHFSQFKTAERMKQNFYWPKMLVITYAAAIPISEIRSVGIGDMVCCNLWKFHIDHGPLYPWTSSPHCPNRMVTRRYG